MFYIVKGKCIRCKKEIEYFSSKEKIEEFYCFECKKNNINFLPIDTINYKYYYKNKGNVSLNRIKMIKNRKLCPDGNGEVVMIERNKITDKLAENY